jgi:DNA-binding NarL/FixJ family response regulator
MLKLLLKRLQVANLFACSIHINQILFFIDIKVEEINGIKATELALKKNKDLAIIGFSSVDKHCYVSQMMEAGAKGFLSKSKNNYDILSEIIKNPKKGDFFSVDLEMDTKIAS